MKRGRSSEDLCLNTIAKIEDIVAAFNSKVFEQYAQHHNEDDMFGGGDFTKEPVPDSLFDKGEKMQYLKELICAQNVFLIIGGGPVGLYMADILSNEFKTHNIIVLENRTEKEHMRKPFSRHRRLAVSPLGEGKLISEIEVHMYTKLNDKENVFFIFSKEISPEYLIDTCEINFVFNATGGRLEEIKNRIQDIIIFDSMNDKRITQDGDDWIYSSFDYDDVELDKIGSDFVSVSKIDHVVSVSQNGKYTDVWVDKNPTSSQKIFSYDELMTYVSDLNPKNPKINEFKTILERKFDPQNSFEVITFDTGFKISTRKPLDYHATKNRKGFFMFNVGESLAAVPIWSGQNVLLAVNIASTIIVPTIMDISRELEDENIMSCLLSYLGNEYLRAE